MSATIERLRAEHPTWAGQPICPPPRHDDEPDLFTLALANLLACDDGSSWT